VTSTSVPTRAPGALRKAAASAFHFDVHAVAIVPALRAAFGCAVVLAVSLPLAGDGGAAAATVGALLAVVPSLSSTARRPIATMVATTFGMALSTFVGSATAHDHIAHLIVLVVWGFAGGLLVALGDTGSIVGTQATMAIIAFGRFAEPVGGAAKIAGELAAGAAFQILLAAVTSWTLGFRIQRSTVADAYRLLAQLALGGTEQPSVPAAVALDTAESALSSPGIVRRPDVEALRSLVDEGKRMRVELGGLEALSQQLARIAPEVRAELASAVGAVLVHAAYVLRAVADAVTDRGEVATEALDLALAEVDRAARALGPADDDPGSSSSHEATIARALADHLAALAGQLRAAAALATGVPGGRAEIVLPRPSRYRRLADSAASQLAVVRANLSLDSTACRHAIRLALAVLVGEVIALQPGLQRGYWVPLTAALVLRPDFASTFSRGFGRLGGTVVGVGITGVIVAGGRLDSPALVAVVAALTFGGCASFRASYAAYSAFLTGLVVILISLATPGGHATLSTALDRLVDTVVGGAIALLAYAAWPTWTTSEAQRALAAALEGERVYLDAVLGSISGSVTVPEAELRALTRSLRLARTNGEAVVARSLAEPHAHRVDGPLAAGLLAAVRRLSLTTHVLRTVLVSPGRTESVPELDPLREALDGALEAIGDALVTGEAPELPPLRRLHAELAQKLGPRRDAALLLVETDEIVDAVDTLGSLLGDRAGEPA
jgi:uncharacterized membrane protein YccC